MRNDSARKVFQNVVRCSLVIGAVSLLPSCVGTKAPVLDVLQAKREAAMEKVMAGRLAEQKAMALECSREELVADRLKEIAEPLVGTRYRYGGSTENGFDCSGFTRSVFEKFDISLPRSSREMAKIGTEVEKDELLPGDLVFFDIRRRGYVSHVGIYVGDGKIVHASRHSGVTYDSLSEEYYEKRYFSARRVLDQDDRARLAANPFDAPEVGGKYIPSDSKKMGPVL